ncbi:RNA polymerase sigma-70 factor [Flagellimonas taeanensis]|uniref:RNA polymerase sigma-70 factor n=1 Tax=Flavobacteriaceae TaxID=49546 RepID=UPI000E67E77B|nr:MULTISPECIES: RNA polymerase sigma-70 factor [Allomuricauda]MDC6386724.1 RNA polymerase sigma-70 factor [Muricauda sp. SK9]RIV49975.1 RNA polymerase sigma-70 factor [Allomuricauda taeanensis]
MKFVSNKKYSNDKATPEKLAKMINQSDRNAFNSLFGILWEPMYIYASSLVMNDSTAKDLVQEVWIDYWQRRETIEVQNIKSYLFKAIRYKCYNALRDMKFNKIQIEVAHSVYIDSEVEMEADLADLSKRIDETISSLPKRCQEVFILSRVNHVNNREIAERLNISQRSVENQISFALRRLRKELSTVKALFF